jgi:hypothetical protein
MHWITSLFIQYARSLFRHILLNHTAAFIFSKFSLEFLYWMVEFACWDSNSLMFVPCIARVSINNKHYALDYIILNKEVI